MTNSRHGPDLNLQSFNDHDIFTLEELNELSRVVKPHLSALNLNIRSLCKHIDELYNLLDNSPFEFDINACSETWITPQVDPESIKIAGYNLLTDNREFSIAGGVALYLKSNVNYMLRDDLKIDGVENIWAHTQDLLVGVISNPLNGIKRQVCPQERGWG